MTGDEALLPAVPHRDVGCPRWRGFAAPRRIQKRRFAGPRPPGPGTVAAGQCFRGEDEESDRTGPRWVVTTRAPPKWLVPYRIDALEASRKRIDFSVV